MLTNMATWSSATGGAYDGGPDMIDCIAHTVEMGAVSATVNVPAGLDAMADYPVAALLAGRREHLDCTFERIECMRLPIHCHDEGIVVVITTLFAYCHDVLRIKLAPEQSKIHGQSVFAIRKCTYGAYLRLPLPFSSPRSGRPSAGASLPPVLAD